ncbi:MAG: hypothetical protein P1P64_06310 [Treponemataceae bacterium]
MKDKNVENIAEWRKAILQLPDQKFFDLMTFYLGEIETPFNKQNLIDDLSAFLRKDEVQEKIFLRISAEESFLISTILIFPKATLGFLKDFFKNELNYYQLKELLNNLEQRLIVFTIEKNGEEIYAVNPYMLKQFRALSSLKTFLIPVKEAEKKVAPNLLSGINILSAYSFFLHNTNCIKLNGELRKKVFERVEKIFIFYRNDLLAFNYLLRAFLNLHLFNNTDKGLEENEEMWKRFAAFSPLEMQSFIVVAASGNYSERYLNLLAKTFAKFFQQLNPKYYYEISELEKAFTLLQENLKIAFAGNEIYEAIDREYETFFQEAENKKTVIELAKMFGLLTGKDTLVTANTHFNENDKNGTVLVSPSFEVTIFPFDDFKKLLPLVSALLPTSVQTTAVFEMSRKTTGLFFECKGDDEALRKIFLENITGELPQNIDISLQQWYQNFSAVKLYSGVVAVVAKEKTSLFEKDMPLHKLVQEKLSDNIFVLRYTNIDDIKEMLDGVGLECLVETLKNYFAPVVNFELNSFENSETNLPFLKLLDFEKDETQILKKDLIKQKEANQQKAEVDKTELFEKIKSLDLGESEKDFLNEQVRRNIIFDIGQLTKSNIKFESVQVSALDYTAKLRLCESAIAQKKKLEISVDVRGKQKTFYCTPVEVKRTPEKDLLRLILHNQVTVKALNISKIARIKILKDAIF